MAVRQSYGYTADYDLIFFSDTHIGRGAGLDGFTASQRYQALLNRTNTLKADFMVNLGDLTNGWCDHDPKLPSYYQQYMDLSKQSCHRIISVRGNHDANNSLYQSVVDYTLTRSYRYGNIAYFKLGIHEEDAESWLRKGECYYPYQAVMLEQFTHHHIYQAAQYRFLFMHLQPNSTWPTNAAWKVPEIITRYLPYFDAVFCGHEGGCERVFMLNGTLVVKASHLADGRVSTDTVLQMHVCGVTRTMTVTAVNFVSHCNTTLWTGRI